MTQNYHQDPTHWPLPMGTGVLVEIDFAKIKTQHIELLSGGLRNLTTATVRACSPYLPKEVQEMMLPDGNGSFGAKVVISEPNVRYLEEAEYRACGLDIPEPESNGLGDLAFTNFERIIAVMDDSKNAALPFSPLGGRVFFEYDLSDESMDLMEVGGAGLVMMEKDVAVENQLATVTATGPDVDYLKVGDRIIVKRSSSSLNFEGERYYFVSNEHEIFAVLQ